VQLFYERHGVWPDPRWLKDDSPEYTRRMEQREQEVMAITDRQERWNQWMFLAQARMVPRFTAQQYKRVRVPEAVHAKLLKRFHELLPHASDEVGGAKVVNAGAGSHDKAKFLLQPDLNNEVHHELVPIFSEWAGVPVEPTKVYGVRVYQDGQTLDDHLDIIETHVISGILHIDSSLDEPYPIQIEGAEGVLASVDLNPGEMLLYESAKSYHQRSVPMKGRYYASIFLHYRPIGWNRTFHDVRAAIPPWWGDEVSEAPPAAGLTVTFHNVCPYAAAELYYITAPVDGKEQMQWLANIPPGEGRAFNTAVGAAFIAVDQSNRAVSERIQIDVRDRSGRRKIGTTWAAHHEL